MLHVDIFMLQVFCMLTLNILKDNLHTGFKYMPAYRLSFCCNSTHLHFISTAAILDFCIAIRKRLKIIMSIFSLFSVHRENDITIQFKKTCVFYLNSVFKKTQKINTNGSFLIKSTCTNEMHLIC